MAVYLVKSADGSERLVEARTSKSAVNHVVADSVTATALKMREVVKRSNNGEKIEVVAAETEAAGE